VAFNEPLKHRNELEPPSSNELEDLILPQKKKILAFINFKTYIVSYPKMST
jgi:hypothetical protein